ncbi:hypothetical protein BGX31_006177, partial [Mortierella sp. GBA43]
MAPAQKAARSVYRMISRILRRGLDQSLLGWLYRRYQQQFDYGHDVYLAAVPFPGHGHGMTEADTPAKHQVVYEESTEAMERRLFEEETRKGYIGDNDDDDLDYDGDDDLGDDHDDDEEDSDSDSFDESDQDSEPGSTGTLTEAPFDYSLLQRRMGLHFQEPSPIPSQRRRSLSQPA